jgi:hypothetical protein
VSSPVAATRIAGQQDQAAAGAGVQQQQQQSLSSWAFSATQIHLCHQMLCNGRFHPSSHQCPHPV